MTEKHIHTDTGIEDLLISYFIKELTAKELSVLDEWVHNSLENRIYFNNLQEIWLASMDMKSPNLYNGEEAYKRFISHIKEK